MLSNKDIAVSIIVGPVLALLAWYGVGQLANEKAAPAISGQSYPLLEKSGCRYSQGLCELENADVVLTLQYVQENAVAQMELGSSHALIGAVMSAGSPGDKGRPQPMVSSSEDGKRWTLPAPVKPRMGDRIYLVVGVGESNYYGDAATTFMYEDAGKDDIDP